MNKYEEYEKLVSYDKRNFSKELVSEFKSRDEVIEEETDTLKDLIDMDLRENVPPQIFEIISCMVDLFEKIEKSE
jgi:type III secretion system FlhB-like substrate exporter